MDLIIKNIKYHLDTEVKTAEVIGYGDNPTEVIIPDCIESDGIIYKVTSIGDWAFEDCKGLTSIVIPDSVTSIGDWAFWKCRSLISINIPDSVISIGGCAFRDCSSLISITLPDSITSIGDSAFSHCKGLTSIVIPDSVTSIGDWAFYRCDNLTSIKIPDSVTSIGENAFNCCWSLPSIVIPENVIEIRDRTFRNCGKLTSITFSDNITYIGRYAFASIGLTLPKRYTEDGRLIAYKAFYADMTCREFQYEEGKTYEIEDMIKMCNCSFNAYTNPLNVFNQIGGKIGKDIFIHEVYLSGEIAEVIEYNNSMVYASRIEIGKRLSINDLKIIINN